MPKIPKISCILLIEDNKFFILSTTKCLKKLYGEKCEIICIQEVDKLDEISKKDIHLVLCDYHLDGITGPDVINAMKGRADYPRKNPPIIIGHTSESKNDKIINDFASTGAISTIAKLNPSNMEILPKIIMEYHARKDQEKTSIKDLPTFFLNKIKQAVTNKTVEIYSDDDLETPKEAESSSSSPLKTSSGPSSY